MLLLYVKYNVTYVGAKKPRNIKGWRVRKATKRRSKATKRRSKSYKKAVMYCVSKMMRAFPRQRDGSTREREMR